MKKILALFAAAALAFGGLTSCSNLSDVTEVSSIKEYGRVAFTCEETITNIKLTGVSGATVTEFGTWANAAAVNAATVKVPVGTWEFTLSATFEGESYYGTASGTITKDATTPLSFNLKKGTAPTPTPTPTPTPNPNPTPTPTPSDVAVTGVSISGKTMVAVGGTITLYPVFTPANATNKTVTWSSSDPSVLTVANGTVTGLKAGSANVVVTAANGIASAAYAVSVIDAASVSGSINIIEESGWLENAYIKWEPKADVDGYNVYVQEVGGSTWTKLDTQLIRKYPSYWRADALGLSAGNYKMKVIGTVSGTEAGTASETGALSVEAYDRDGYAHSNWTAGVGAYKDDGTLKANAQVLYVTKNTAKTVSMNVTGAESNPCVGIQKIIDAYQKGRETRPLAVRVIGLVKKGDLDGISSSEEGIQIKGRAAKSEMNITIEGVGDDATVTGFGFLIRNCKSVEMRNLGIYYCMDDCVSLDTGNSNIWIHNMDFFYGPNSGGDHIKGDGALDTKGTEYATHSYNHFWDTGKTHLNSNGDEVNYVTYHHNWYDHSDSRHPRVRKSSAIHVYNNYFDGNSKYGSGATTGCSIFVENNYFRNSKYPMLISMQGNDYYGGTNTKQPKGTFSSEAGGMIKAFGNHIEGSNTSYMAYGADSIMMRGTIASASAKGIDTTVHFDAYQASSRNETVPSTIVTFAGGTSYSNFDTSSSMYSYTVQTPEEAKETVMKYAGRVNGGDLKFTFDNATQDTNYEVVPELETKLKAYASTLVTVQGEDETVPEGGTTGGTTEGGTTGGTTTGGETTGGTTEGGTTGGTTTGATTCNFASGSASNSAFTTAGSKATGKGSVTVDGTTYDTGWKLDSNGSVSFTTDSQMTMTVYYLPKAAGSDKLLIDGTATDKTSLSGTTCILTKVLEAGAHTIAKASGCEAYVYFISLE